jgi:hypothetical protein
MLLVLLFQLSTLLLVLSLLPGWPHSLLGSTDPHPLQQQRVLP